MNKTLFVTGTGTDVGKTYVSALILKKLVALGESAGYYKAAMSGDKTDDFGNPVAEDAEYAKRISGIEQSVESMCPYVFCKPCSPHLAAKSAGEQIDEETIMSGYGAVLSRYKYVVAEGSGGIVCPLRYDSQKLFLSDVILKMNAPCVIVANSGLGAINAVALTAQYVRSLGIKIKGVIFNNYADDEICRDNAYMCEQITGLKILAKVRRGDTEISENVKEWFQR